MYSAQPPVTFRPLQPATSATTPVQQASPQMAQPTSAPVIVQQVGVTPTVSRSDLLVETEHWTWSELRDYVASSITERFGPFPRDARKEHSIFNRFFNQYGADAIAVAKYAFGPVCDGWWRGAPISINRFCKSSDPYFVAPIMERLADVEGAASPG
jgi:hypothetical protein